MVAAGEVGVLENKPKAKVYIGRPAGQLIIPLRIFGSRAIRL